MSNTLLSAASLLTCTTATSAPALKHAGIPTHMLDTLWESYLVEQDREVRAAVLDTCTHGGRLVLGREVEVRVARRQVRKVLPEVASAGSEPGKPAHAHRNARLRRRGYLECSRSAMERKDQTTWTELRPLKEPFFSCSADIIDATGVTPTPAHTNTIARILVKSNIPSPPPNGPVTYSCGVLFPASTARYIRSVHWFGFTFHTNSITASSPGFVPGFRTIAVKGCERAAPAAGDATDIQQPG
eukprot:2331378-Rhodomonas_salina.2